MKAFGLCTHVRKPLDAVQSLGNIGEKVWDGLSFFDMFLNCLISHSLAEVAFAGGGSAHSQYHSEASRDESTKGVKDNMLEGADLVFCLGGGGGWLQEPETALCDMLELNLSAHALQEPESMRT
ncbi:hypothetical protein QC762_0078660 [Podospora pseudocomata]|uniref:Uncharacterized protein n=1 Tax=Podospora pseudocomata TaxID=2093779 RepID=A0ABR0GB31_9PEZI|nr:hypothetical protein QC762_0078660 [Podospora pseudocomata]